MKRVIFLCIIVFSILNSNAQKLTLADLSNLCNKKNWEDVNQILLSKNWSYYDSQKGSSSEYNTISWSFNKEEYSDKAQGWFYLYTYDDFPNKVVYSVFNKESYNLIQNSLSSNGFNLTKSEIEDNKVISTYSNQNYNLQISTSKHEDSEWSSRSFTAYSITLIKKAGIYDPDNGNKTVYYDDGTTISAEYNLKNGNLHGPLKVYYQNGNIKKTGTYLNGKENGLFREYNEDGIIYVEYFMKDGVKNGAFKSFYNNGHIKSEGSCINGKENGSFREYTENGDLQATYTELNAEYNGLLTVYENGKISKKVNYLNGIKEGAYTELNYGDNDSLFLEYSGVYNNGMKEGVWTLCLHKGDKKEIAGFTTYKNDIKDGKFKSAEGDSLIFGSYINDKLEGDYIVYKDIRRTFFGQLIQTDSTGLDIESKGHYFQGKRSGNWVFYFFGQKIKEGRYVNDLKEGEWKYYYPNYADAKGNNINFSGKLFLTKTYQSDKLYGKSVRYSYLDKVRINCDTIVNKAVNPLDTCTKDICVKVFESSFYKNDSLYGPYCYKDSTGTLRLEGNYINNKKEGKWIVSHVNAGVEGKKYIVYEEGDYKDDLKEGKWIEYVTKDYIWNEANYKYGKLNGTYYRYNKNKKPIEIREFEENNLKSISVYDTIKTSIVRKFEILSETDGFIKVRSIVHTNDSIISIDYHMNKSAPVLDPDLFEVYMGMLLEIDSIGENIYPDGVLTLADSKNNIIMTGNRLKEDRIGLWKFNYPDKNVQIQIEYNKGKSVAEKYFVFNSDQLFSGTFEYVDNERNIKEERKIKNGYRNSKTIYKDIKTGKTIKIEKYEEGKII
jgi:antitoxin component YwqK of YwqJK toxin-antitoxin module